MAPPGFPDEPPPPTLAGPRPPRTVPSNKILINGLEKRVYKLQRELADAIAAAAAAAGEQEPPPLFDEPPPPAPVGPRPPNTMPSNAILVRGLEKRVGELQRELDEANAAVAAASRGVSRDNYASTLTHHPSQIQFCNFTWLKNSGNFRHRDCPLGPWAPHLEGEIADTSSRTRSRSPRPKRRPERPAPVTTHCSGFDNPQDCRHDGCDDDSSGEDGRVVETSFDRNDGGDYMRTM